MTQLTRRGVTCRRVQAYTARPEQSIMPPRRLSGWTLGICCILTVAVIWSASSVLVQAIFTHENFSRPFFLTWVANSLFMVTLPLRAIGSYLRRRFGSERAASATSSEETAAVVIDSAGGDGSSTAAQRPAELRRRAMRAGIIVSPVWFAANCTCALALGVIDRQMKKRD